LQTTKLQGIGPLHAAMETAENLWWVG